MSRFKYLIIIIIIIIVITIIIRAGYAQVKG